MLTVMRAGRYRFVFFSNEGIEPEPIHVKADRNESKFWLDPVFLAVNYGFKAHELNEIEELVIEHQSQLLEALHEYFD